LTARLEASLDFPEEGYHFADPGEVVEQVERVRHDVDALLARADEGRVIREGRTVVIAGPVNAGKSSLFNGLVGLDRAIVDATPGTTRDLLVEHVDVAGIPVTLVDTAGLRDAGTAVEAEGVRRARLAAADAALTVLVLDRSQPLGAEHRDLLRASHNSPRLVVANKTDLPPAWSPAELGVDRVCEVSARTGDGLGTLRTGIAGALGRERPEIDVPRVTNVRHIMLLKDVDRALRIVLDDLLQPTGAAPEEVIVQGLTTARERLEEISGRRTPEDVLNHIFARFCIGK
jgi:tRNA modification GTPase